MKSVSIKCLAINPIPPGKEQGLSCNHCEKLIPRWEVDGELSCSRCFIALNLKDQQAEVENLVSNVEKAMGNPLGRDEEGLLSEISADRIVGGLVLAQRYEMGKSKNES